MKKRIFFLLFAFALNISLFAQSTDNEHIIIGTWTNNTTGSTWVFTTDGNLTIGTDRFTFGVTDDKLAILENRNLRVFNVSMSSDGKTIILESNLQSASGFSTLVWLTKK